MSFPIRFAILCTFAVYPAFLNAQYKEIPVTVHSAQVFHLNSGGRGKVGMATFGMLDAKSKVVLEVKLPENTVAWYYSFSASRDAAAIERTRKQLQLASKLTRLVDETGTTALALDLLTQPPGDNFCDILLLDSEKQIDLFQKEINFKNMKYHVGGSRENYVSGNVGITTPERCQGSQYLGFSNPDAFYAVSVAVEVVAIVRKPIEENGWTQDMKNDIYSVCQKVLAAQPARLSEVQRHHYMSCLLTTLFREQNKTTVENKAAYELGMLMKGRVEKCAKGLGMDSIVTLCPNLHIQLADAMGGSSTLSYPSNTRLMGTWKSEGHHFALQSGGKAKVLFGPGKPEVAGTWSLKERTLEIKYAGAVSRFLVQSVSPGNISFSYFAEGHGEKLFTAVK